MSCCAACRGARHTQPTSFLPACAAIGPAAHRTAVRGRAACILANLIVVTDGQIVLQGNLFQRRHGFVTYGEQAPAVTQAYGACELPCAFAYSEGARQRLSGAATAQAAQAYLKTLEG